MGVAQTPTHGLLEINMLVFKLKNAIPFSKREKDAFVCLCRAWMKYNPQVASFLMQIMGKSPEETNYELDLSNINVKWVSTQDTNVLGCWNVTTPNNLYIGTCCIEKVDGYKGSITVSDRINRFEMVISSMMVNFGIIMHEFYHMFQFKMCPVGYIFMRLVTVFTKLPYYAVQHPLLSDYFPDGENTEIIQKWCKLTEWDLEGQAEKYGNKVDNIEDFLSELDTVFTAYCFRDSMQRSFDKAKDGNGGVDPTDTYSKELIENYVNEQTKDCSPQIFRAGTELYNILKNNS